MKNFILAIAFFLSGFAVQAQDQRDADPVKREQKVKALYVAFISQELKLNEDEAQKFWPVHAQFDNEVKTVKMDLSELDRQQSVLNIKKKYQDRFTRIIGAERTDAFFRSDAEFRKKLVERLKNMRQQNNGKQRPLLNRN